MYNVKTTYIESSNIVVIDSLNRKLEVADSNKENQVKYKPTGISRTVDKVKRGENVTLVNDSSKDGWVKIRTDSGKLGYVKEDSITNKLTIRNNMVTSEKLMEMLVWYGIIFMNMQMHLQEVENKRYKCCFTYFLYTNKIG